MEYLTELKEYRNKNHHVVIPCTRLQVVDIFKGLGICDSCNSTDTEGFLLPVLGGQWFCTKCKNEWEATAKFYAEDADYEYKKAMAIIKVFVFNNVVFFNQA